MVSFFFQRYIKLCECSCFSCISYSEEEFAKDTFSKDFRIHVKYNGDVTWSFGSHLFTLCPLDLTYYPLDLQKCDIVVENFAYTAQLVALFNASANIELDTYQDNGAWQILATTATTTTYQIISYKTREYSRVIFTLYLKRRFHLHYVNTLIPTLMCVIISWLMFGVPPEAKEKLAMGTVALVVFTVFMVQAVHYIPRTATSTPLFSESLSSLVLILFLRIVYAVNTDLIFNNQPGKIVKSSRENQLESSRLKTSSFTFTFT